MLSIVIRTYLANQPALNKTIGKTIGTACIGPFVLEQAYKRILKKKLWKIGTELSHDVLNPAHVPLSSRRTAEPLGPTSVPGCDEPTSRCQTTPLIRTLKSHKPVIPSVPFIR